MTKHTSSHSQTSSVWCTAALHRWRRDGGPTIIFLSLVLHIIYSESVPPPLHQFSSPLVTLILVQPLSSTLLSHHAECWVIPIVSQQSEDSLEFGLDVFIDRCIALMSACGWNCHRGHTNTALSTVHHSHSLSLKLFPIIFSLHLLSDPIQYSLECFIFVVPHFFILNVWVFEGSNKLNRLYGVFNMVQKLVLKGIF